MADEFIAESELGTKEYWDRFYADELNNFHDHGDSGETWFGTRNVQKIVQWLETNVPKDSFICDIGCGNGYVLSKLATRGYRNLYGVDYSPKAIEFCQAQFSHVNSVEIHFQVVDILADDNSLSGQKFDAMIDKGTFDAICLMPDADLALNREKYLRFLDRHLKTNGHFVIVSCNFTKDELVKVLSTNNNFECIQEFDAPVLSFGGSAGKQVTGLVFLNKEKMHTAKKIN